MRKILILPIVFMVMLALPLVQSWGPHTHNLLSQAILSENTTEIGRICNTNEESRLGYRLGVMTPDLTVIYYYEEGGKEYRLSHNWNFQQELTSQAVTDNERCFAWGVAAHLVQDGIAHNDVIPKAINNFRVKNWIIHPLLEKKYDSAIVTKNPSLKTSTPRLMDALDGPNGERYIEMIDYAMGDNSNIDVKSELTKLRFALDEFYETQFRPSGSTWVFQAYPYIDKLTNSISPLVGDMKFANIDLYYKKSKDQTVSVFNNWGSRYQIEPHGFTKLQQADRNSTFTFTLILIAAFVIPFGLMYFLKKPIYILLIPLILILLIVGLYASL